MSLKRSPNIKYPFNTMLNVLSVCDAILCCEKYSPRYLIIFNSQHSDALDWERKRHVTCGSNFDPHYKTMM